MDCNNTHLQQMLAENDRRHRASMEAYNPATG